MLPLDTVYKLGSTVIGNECIQVRLTMSKRALDGCGSESARHKAEQLNARLQPNPRKRHSISPLFEVDSAAAHTAVVASAADCDHVFDDSADELLEGLDMPGPSSCYSQTTEFSEPAAELSTCSSSSYGLVPDQLSNTNMLHLPVEILQEILCHLPTMDLMLVANRVCRAWKTVVDSERFLPHEKLHLKYMREHKPTVQMVEGVLADVSVERSLCHILTHVGEECGSVLLPDAHAAFMQRLQTHQLYDAAANCVNVLQLQRTPWVQLCVQLVLCPSASAMHGVLQRQCRPPLQWSSSRVLECVHLLAALLLAAHRTLAVSARTSYNLQQALHWAKTQRTAAGSSGSGLQLTAEQQRIVNYDLRPTECVKINALAGTGKTSTLVEYARRRPQLTFLLLVFNRSAAEDARSRFPSNTVVSTVHALAYNHPYDRTRSIGQHFSQHLNRSVHLNLNSIAFSKVIQSVEQLPARDRQALKGIAYFTRCKLLQQTLSNYFCSADRQLSVQHVPEEYRRTEAEMRRIKEPPASHYVELSPAARERFMLDAAALWADMCSPDGSLPVSHDAYLKYFQLLSPQLRHYHNHDVLLCDEAQDMNPAMLDIVNSQHDTPTVLVGDPYQQIYSFRGAVNALQQVECSRTFTLTESFRFGPELAFLATEWLKNRKNVRRQVLFGSRGERETQLQLPNSWSNHRNITEQVHFLARRKSTLFALASQLASLGRKILVIGGVDTFRLDDLEDLYTLSLAAEYRHTAPGGGRIKNQYLQKFSTLEEALRDASAKFKTELEDSIHTVTYFNAQIPSMVRSIRASQAGRPADATFVLSTVHKAKGLEFDNVLLCADFIDPQAGNPHAGQTEMLKERNDEDNLQYVAMTRAKRRMLLNGQPHVLSLFWGADDGFCKWLPVAQLFGQVGQAAGGGGERSASCRGCDQPIALSHSAQLIYTTQRVLVCCARGVNSQLVRATRPLCWCVSCAHRRVCTATYVLQSTPHITAGIREPAPLVVRSTSWRSRLFFAALGRSPEPTNADESFS